MPKVCRENENCWNENVRREFLKNYFILHPEVCDLFYNQTGRIVAFWSITPGPVCAGSFLSRPSGCLLYIGIIFRQLPPVRRLPDKGIAAFVYCYIRIISMLRRCASSMFVRGEVNGPLFANAARGAVSHSGAGRVASNADPFQPEKKVPGRSGRLEVYYSKVKKLCSFFGFF